MAKESIPRNNIVKFPDAEGIKRKKLEIVFRIIAAIIEISNYMPSNNEPTAEGIIDKGKKQVMKGNDWEYRVSITLEFNTGNLSLFQNIYNKAIKDAGVKEYILVFETQSELPANEVRFVDHLIMKVICLNKNE